jgi:hypothetical protein
MDKEIKFSFLKLFNTLKGIYRPVKEYNDQYLENEADEKTKLKYERFFKWCDENGIEHPKVKYPVMFGSGKNSYPGMMATETIGANETIIKVPAKMVLTSKTAFYSEIN